MNRFPQEEDKVGEEEEEKKAEEEDNLELTGLGCEICTMLSSALSLKMKNIITLHLRGLSQTSHPKKDLLHYDNLDCLKYRTWT